MSNTKNLANLAAALDDGTSGQVLQSTGSGGVTFAAASGGGSMTVYNGINGSDGTPSGYTYLTNASSPSNGDLAFVTANNTVYVRASSGWRKIATIQESPGTITGHSASYPSIGQNATTDITLSSTDPEGFDVTWSYTVGGNGTLSGSNINNSNGDTLASIAVQTANANSGGTNTITYRITRQTTTIAGDFTVTFTATDTQATGTSDTGAISFELSFIVTDSHHSTLLMATDGSAGDNKDIADSSSSNHTITSYNDAHAGTFSPYRHGGYSNYFDGSNDYLAIPNDTGFGFGTGSWTFETWLYCTKTGASNAIFDLRVGTGTQTGAFGIGMLSNGQVQMFSSDFNGAFYKPSETLSFNEWQHLAIVKDASANETQMYFNGTATSLTHSDTNNYGSSQPVQIAKDDWTNYFGGYLRDLRVVKGTAVYSGNFTPPTGPLTTTGGQYSSTTNVNTSITSGHTKLLTCHLPYFKDGSSNDHSITLNDSPETRPFAPYDHEQYSKSVNGGSIHFDGTGDYLTVYDTGLSVGNNSAFTVEFWFLTSKNPDALQNIWNTYSTSTASMADEQLKFAYNNSSTGLIALYDRQNSGNILEVTKKLGRNTWNHFCWTRDASNNHKFYINGEQIGTSTSSTSYDTNRMAFGVREYNSTSYLEGNISDFRLVKGTVVYSGEFTPPTGPLTTTGGTYSDTTNVNTSITSGHTKLLLSGTDAHVIDKSQGSNLKLVGNAAAVTDAPNNSNISSTNALSLDGTGDYVTATGIPIRSGDFTLEAWVRPASFANYRTIFTNRGTSNSSSNFVLGVNSSAQVYLWSSSFLITSSSTLSANTWHHIALVRNGTGTGSTVLYIDGSSVGSANVSNNFSDTAYDIGGDTVDSNHWNGYIQDLRVSVGKARYTSNFTVPSAPLSA